MDGIKIVLPEAEFDEIVQTGAGTKVYYRGNEIEGIIGIDIRVRADEIITANIKVVVDEIENADFITPVLESCPLSNLEELAIKHGYKLVKDS